jgi:alkyl sulfatase BDS1-like metallo-beta-lactamase superfamily hydrolase
LTTISESSPRCIAQLAGRFNDPAIASSLNGLTKTLQVSLTDLNEDYVFNIKDGLLSGVERRSLPTPDITVTIASPLMEGIMNGKSKSILAYFTGKLKMKGTREDLLRLQKLIG